MALKRKGETSESLVYLNVSRGFFVMRNGSREEQFTAVTGYLKEVGHGVRQFHGEDVPFCYFHVKDADSEDVFAIATPLRSGYARGVILSLLGLSPERLREPLEFGVYQKDGFNKSRITCGGEFVPWAPVEVPSAEDVRVGDAVVKDHTKRDAFILEKLEEIKKNLNI